MTIQAVAQFVTHCYLSLVGSASHIALSVVVAFVVYEAFKFSRR